MGPLAAAGWNVVATVHRTTVDSRPGVTICRVDLTDQADVGRMVAAVSPDVIVHLAAVIAPQIYREPGDGPQGQRRRDGGAGARRRSSAASPPVRPRIQRKFTARAIPIACPTGSR
jgi:hypothetical protein